MNSAPAEKARPVLIQFHDQVLNNMTMESVGTLTDAMEIFLKKYFTHAMTMEDQEEYKLLTAEAKDKEKDDLSVEFIYRVKWAAGSYRVLKIHKIY